MGHPPVTSGAAAATNSGANTRRINPWVIYNLSWLFLLIPTVAHSGAILHYRCWFFDSYLTCSSNPASAVKFLNVSWFLLFFAGVTWSYLRLICSGDSLKFTLGKTAPALLGALLMVPWGSSDCFYYTGIGNRLLHGANPYIDGLDRLNPFAGTMAVTHFRSATYQPLWVVICAAVVRLAGSSQLVAAYLFKLVALASHILAACLLGNLFRREKGSHSIVAAYLLNPLMVFEFAGNGHLDATMLCLLLLGMLALFRGAWLLCFVGLAIACTVKLSAMLLLPLLAVYLWNQFGIIGLLRAALGSIIVAGALVIAYLPFWHGAATLAGLGDHRAGILNTPFSAAYTIFVLLAQTIGAGAYATQLRLGLTVLFVVAAVTLLLGWRHFWWKWLSRRDALSPIQLVNASVVALIIYFSLIERVYWPWYAALFFPLSLLLENNNAARRLSICLTIAGLGYYACYLAAGYTAAAHKSFQIVVASVLFAPALIVLYRRGRNRITRQPG